MISETFDVVVICAGQAGLASAYYLRRASLSFVLLDAEDGPGGAWRHGWNSLHLFSPASFSSLPGWMMPSRTNASYPAKSEVIDYLTRYEERYKFPIERPMVVTSVRSVDGALELIADKGRWRARAVLSTTGSWRHPIIPEYPNAADFTGQQIHLQTRFLLRNLRASASPLWVVEIPVPKFWQRYRRSLKPSG